MLRLIERTAQVFVYLCPTVWLLAFAAARAFDWSAPLLYLGILGVPLLFVSFMAYLIGKQHWRTVPGPVNAGYRLTLKAVAIVIVLAVFGIV